MWAIDHPSMILVILGGLHLGLEGAFGINLVERFLGNHIHGAYLAIGLAAIWQLTRQRFPVSH